MTSAPKYRPILFSAPMVRALLNGSKTQTRRVVSKNDAALLEFLAENTDQLGQKNEDGGTRVWCDDYREEGSDVLKSRYGQVGDQLWVRETFLIENDYQPHESVIYRADGMVSVCSMGCAKIPWKPSIFMPRWASRITLEITSVRVERLQDIGALDALAEGVSMHDHFKGRHDNYGPVAAYKDLWESINGDDSWAANQWVWVIEFKRIGATA